MKAHYATILFSFALLLAPLQTSGFGGGCDDGLCLNQRSDLQPTGGGCDDNECVTNELILLAFGGGCDDNGCIDRFGSRKCAHQRQYRKITRS